MKQSRRVGMAHHERVVIKCWWAVPTYGLRTRYGSSRTSHRETNVPRSPGPCFVSF